MFTITRRTYARCTDCHRTATRGATSPDRARSFAQSDGWATTPNGDYCPDCRHSLRHWGRMPAPSPVHPTPADFIAALEADGYDHAVDRTLPRSAINWPGWVILALRPRFALSFPAWSRTLAVLAFRCGFATGLAELVSER